MTPHARRQPAQLVAATFVAVMFTLLMASPVGADGVKPGNFESRIDSAEPSNSSVKVDVLGGDSFLRVTAKPGAKVMIPGYDGEPYLRIDSDGSVYDNKLSPSTYLNTTRNGQAQLPEFVTGTAKPEWRKIGNDGTVSWHDHRIHWMGSESPTVGNDGMVQQWVLPLTVNGKDITVSGTLYRRPNLTPWPAALMAIAAVVVVILAARTADWSRDAALLVTSVVALGISLSVAALNPPGAQASPLPIILPAIAIVASGASLTIRRLPVQLRDLVLPLAAGAALVGWVIPLIGALWMPFLPSTLPAWLVRVGVALAIGTTIGAIAAIVAKPPAATPRSSTAK